MTLNETQKQQVNQWLADGLKVAEVQKRLEAEFGIRMTYMEVRFLLDDLKLIPKDPEPVKPLDLPEKSPLTPATNAPADPPPVAPDEAEDALEPAGPAGSVSVSVDELALPGSVVSGSVTFSDGESAQWYLDQMGRLGLATKKKGYKPSALDLQQFQLKLESELSRMGF